MKTLYKLIHISAPLTIAILFALNGPATASVAAMPATNTQSGVVIDGGEDKTTEAKADKKTTTNKPKKIKMRRVNHGPRKPLYPQTDRKKEKLSRARFLNAHR